MAWLDIPPPNLQLERRGLQLSLSCKPYLDRNLRKVPLIFVLSKGMQNESLRNGKRKMLLSEDFHI